jgi:hypothetical protein
MTRPLPNYFTEYRIMEFNVVQFFKDGSYEYVRNSVSPEEAVKAFKHYTENVAARIGITERVIITDGGDCIAMEWKRGQGITFPTKEELDASTHG